MDIHKMMQTGEGIEELENHLLGLDSEFRFKCRRCGKCCTHQDTIILTARDIYNIAKKQGRETAGVIESYTEVYIGKNSRLPVVHLLSNGPKGTCPLLEEGRCSVHDSKPVVCALFPLGRVIKQTEGKDPLDDDMEIETAYIMNDITCGSVKKVNTVRSWLEKFGIPEHDEFFVLWNRTVMALSMMIRRMEEEKVSEKFLNDVWGIIFTELYLHYDMQAEFMPQFQANAERLLQLARMIRDIPEDEMAESEAEDGKK